MNVSFVQLGAVTTLVGATADRRGIFSDSVSVPGNARATAASFVVKGRRRSTQDISCSVAFAVLPIPTAAWGVDAYSAPTGAIDTLELDMGRPFAAWAGYRRIDDASTYLHFIATPMSRGALVYLNINNYAIDPTTGAHVPFCWSSVSAGNEDTMIDAWAQVILASAYMDKTIITFDHEPDVDSSNQPKCITDTPSAYQAAFDYFFKRMRTDGVTSRFAFVPTVRVYSNGLASSYLPPAGDFQVIGADIYNNVNDPTKANYRTVPQAFDPLYSWVAANETGMPIVIGELGEVQDDPNAPQWIGDALATMKSHGNLLFVNWNVVDTSTNYYSPLLRSDSYQVWLAGAADPYFSG